MNIKEFYEKLNELYPVSLRCEWDNDGIMYCEDLSCPVKKIAVALDVTEESIQFAADQGCNVLLAHHPLIFKPIKNIAETNVTGTRIIKAMKAGLTVICIHTRLDAGNGGVNDELADILKLNNIESFGDEENPVLGRIGYLEKEISLRQFAEYVKKALKAPVLNVTPSGNENMVKKVAVVGGAGKDLIYPAIQSGADVLVTGEIGYNSCIDGADSGLSIIEAGHFFSENPVVSRLSAIVKEMSGVDAACFNRIKTYTI